MRSSVLLIVLLIPYIAFSADDDTQNKWLLRSFERRIRPLLAEHCVGCHGPRKQEAGLRLDSKSSVFAKHDFGFAVVPRKPEQSRLIQVVRYAEDDVQMPPKKKLPAKEIDVITRWIRTGAVWPKERDPVAKADPNAWRKHWAFQPITVSKLPVVKDDRWPFNEVDRFVLARLEQARLKPSTQATTHNLVRRAYFDLLGTPPTFEQVQQVAGKNASLVQLADSDWRGLVDRLLESPHFGERWARYWMDIARYSDTSGYLFRDDRKLGDAYKYRDWLINAFNSDMPIDEFLIHQIAVDRILPADAGDRLAATGFLTLGRRFLNNKHDIIDDRIDVITRGMMGFTVTCARCHDHKYDPIPSADYYSLYGVLASTREPERKKTNVRLEDLPRPFNPYVFVRGQAHNHGPRVPRQFLGAISKDRKPFTDGSGRKELAEAIVHRDNPLTSRVFVNRVWGHLMGSHLVDTPSDFGVRSNPPTHPLLLDYLASTFMEKKWSMKRLIREIMLSRTYRQSSSGPNAKPPAGDPENRLLSRMNRRRLDFEAHRDSLLTVSGKLDRTIGGPSVDITSASYSPRRSVYAFIDRQNLPGVFRAFDLASPDTHAPQRYQTTVPQQGLYLLNNPFVLDQAVAVANRSASELNQLGGANKSVAGTNNSADRVRRLVRLVYGRQPSSEELAASLAFVSGREANRHQGAGWRYGYGLYDPKQNRVTKFTHFPFFSPKTKDWHDIGALPSKRIGWAHLDRTGGHPGHARHLAAIRRWIAPAAGQVTIRGVLNHPSPSGDGVVGKIVFGEFGKVGEWTAAHGPKLTTVKTHNIKAGETIDFVCECLKTDSFDTFHWNVDIRFRTKGGVEDTFNSESQFSQKRLELLDTWSQLAHVLLMSNEFVFID